MATLTGTAAKGSGEDWSNVLAEVPLFAGLSKRHIKAIARLAKVRRVARYSVLVHEGEPGNSFYLLLEGNASVVRPGKRAIRLKPGAFFGELALLDDAPRSATVEAETDLLVAQIGRASFLKMLEAEPKVGLRLLQTLAVRLRASESAATH
jgi:cAMP-dependent protein kinase regulator